MLDFTPTQKEYLYNCFCGDCRDIINPVGSSMIIREDISYQVVTDIFAELNNWVYQLESTYKKWGLSTVDFKNMVLFLFGQFFDWYGITDGHLSEEFYELCTMILDYADSDDDSYYDKLVERFKEHYTIYNDIPENVKSAIRVIKQYYLHKPIPYAISQEKEYDSISRFEYNPFKDDAF